MRSFWAVLAPAICVVALCGSAILWIIHKEGINKASLARATSESRLSAEKGDAQAQYRLGRMYFQGEGVPQDYTQAALWYHKAADQDYAKAQYALGYMYYFGHGVQQSYSEAVRWYRKAADQGDASAEINLALAYYYGQGLQQDYTEAVNYYREAAGQSDPKGDDGLGLMYYQGRGVQQDYAEAARWYRRAADRGLAKAQYDLGVLYYNGQGVPRNRAEADRWFYKAAAQGNRDARQELGSPLTVGRKVELSAEIFGGILLFLGFFLSRRDSQAVHAMVAPTAAALCIVTACLSWYGYTHYEVRCLACGLNEFTVGKWVLDAVLVAMLIYIVRPRKSVAERPRQQ